MLLALNLIILSCLWSHQIVEYLIGMKQQWEPLISGIMVIIKKRSNFTLYPTCLNLFYYDLMIAPADNVSLNGGFESCHGYLISES